MPRLPRLDIEGTPQHVIQRGNNRQACFFHPADYVYYLECLRDAAAAQHCDVHAYVMMTNHSHLLITPHHKGALSRLMQSIGRRYVQYINQHYQRSGTLWEGRYRASLVDTETYLLACYRYIELNPVRAGIAKHPREYPWSSFAANAYGKEPHWLEPHPEYRRLGRDPATRKQAYRALFKAPLNTTQISEIRQCANQGVVLGSARFRDEIEQALKVRASPGRRGRPSRQS